MNRPIDPVEQFFSIFAQANAAVWPMQLVWYAAAIAAVVLAIRSVRAARSAHRRVSGSVHMDPTSRAYWPRNAAEKYDNASNSRSPRSSANLSHKFGRQAGFGPKSQSAELLI
jgi:hypothetical protein